MGEAKRRKKLGLQSNKRNPNSILDESPKLVNWLPVTQKQKDQFIEMSIKTSWIGIALLVFLWLIVRFIGPALGWWIPADGL